MFQRILCPTDLQERSHRGLEKAVQLAHQFDAGITLLNVHPEFMDSHEREMLRISVDKMKKKYRRTAEKAKESMQRTISDLHAEDVPITYLLRGGKPTETILAVAAEMEADLIVMVSDGRDNIRDYLAGTITEHVVNRSDCPVLVVPCKRGGEEG